MDTENPNRTELSPEDAQRLNRLSEEVRGRLTEMVSIIGRTTGNDDFGVGEITKFEPRTAAKSAADSSGGWMEIFEVFGIQGAYGHIEGHWFVELKAET